MRTAIQYKSFTLAPREQLSYPVAGNKFFCKSASFPFSLQTDMMEVIEGVESGFLFDLASVNDRFVNLRFINPSATETLTIVFYAGNVLAWGLWSQRTQVVQLASTSGFAVDVNGTVGGGGGNNLASGASFAIPQSYNDQIRKQFILTNASTVDLQLLDGAGHVCAVIFSRSQFVLASTGAFTVLNNTTNVASGVYCEVEVYT